jgi:surface protein
MYLMFGSITDLPMQLVSIGDTSSWNESNVTNFAGMFQTCAKLETLDVANWNVSKVKNFQNMIRPAIIRLVDNIIAVASLYDMKTDDGQSVAQLAARGYEVNVAMDDGITQDRQTNINEGIALVGAGLMSKKTFLTDPKYGQALTEEAADAELQRIADESRVNSLTLDRLNLGTAE